jgi:hypothetical protein
MTKDVGVRVRREITEGKQKVSVVYVYLGKRHFKSILIFRLELLQ